MSTRLPIPIDTTPLNLSRPIGQLPATREVIAAKLLYHLELAFGRRYSLSDSVAAVSKGHKVYFQTLIGTHFALHINDDRQAIALSETLDDLVTRICNLRGIVPEQLDLLKELPAPPVQYRH